MRIFPKTQDFPLFEFKNYFRWRKSTSIYIVNDQKLTTGAHGLGVADNMTAKA